MPNCAWFRSRCLSRIVHALLRPLQVGLDSVLRFSSLRFLRVHVSDCLRFSARIHVITFWLRSARRANSASK